MEEVELNDSQQLVWFHIPDPPVVNRTTDEKWLLPEQIEERFMNVVNLIGDREKYGQLEYVRYESALIPIIVVFESIDVQVASPTHGKISPHTTQGMAQRTARPIRFRRGTYPVAYTPIRSSRLHYDQRGIPRRQNADESLANFTTSPFGVP